MLEAVWHRKLKRIVYMETTPLNPEQIAEYIHEEHTPYASMSLEEGKKHLAELIQKYADDYHVNKLAEFGDHQE